VTSPIHRPGGIHAALLVLAVLQFSCGSNAPLVRGSNAVSAAGAAAHVGYLASDALLGRNTPSPGLDSAAAYLARQFRQAGLQPVNGSYYQEVRMQIVALGDSNALSLSAEGKSDSFAIKDDFVPFEMTADGGAQGELVFAGYGITSADLAYDDYAGLDVKGKIVVILRHYPRETDSTLSSAGRKDGERWNIPVKVKRAMELGAAGVMVMSDPINHTSLTPRGFPWPSLSKIIPKDALPMTLMPDNDVKIPVVHVGERVIARLFGSVDSLRRIEQQLDAAMKPASFAFRGTSVTLRTSTVTTVLRAQNVVGMIPGADAVRKDSVVVIGAHYDHVGYKKNSPAGTDSIFNGADDNASGTAALVEAARAAGAAGARPARTLLFIAFAGEEKGLFGSEWYVRHPLLPLTKTIAMLNMDMVGMNAPDSLFLITAPRHRWLEEVVRAQNGGSGFTLVSSGLDFGGSDHMSFTKRDIPAIFFHSGLHPYYHKVVDEASLLNPDKIARVAALAFRTAWALTGTANQ
jgi:aminopeptidase YwaD